VGVFIWLIAALVLACGELAIGDFTLLMLAGGALAAAGVSLAHVPTWVEVVVFGVTSIGMIFSLRPMLRKRLLTAPPPFKGDSAVAVAYQHVEQIPPTPSSILSDIPDSLDRDVLKALAQKHDDPQPRPAVEGQRRLFYVIFGFLRLLSGEG